VASGVVITSDVPPGTTLASCSSNAACLLTGTRLTATLGTLDAGANIIASVQLVPQKGGSLTFSFNAGSLGWDRQNNNMASINVQVLESADIGIMLGGPPSVLAGRLFTLSVQMENRSEFAANAPAFTLTLPAGVTYKGSSGGNWTCSQNASAILQCLSASPLPPRSQSPVDVLLSSGDAPAELQFIGNATSTTFDPNPSNNTDNKLMFIDTQLKTFIPVAVR
jgi:hypothetical protein